MVMPGYHNINRRQAYQALRKPVYQPDISTGVNGMEILNSLGIKAEYVNKQLNVIIPDISTLPYVTANVSGVLAQEELPDPDGEEHYLGEALGEW